MQIDRACDRPIRMQISVLLMMLRRRSFCPAAVPFQDVVSVFKHARDSPFLKRFDVLCINFKMNSEGVPGCLWMLMGACACLEHGGFPLRRDKSFLLNQHVVNIPCRDNT